MKWPIDGFVNTPIAGESQDAVAVICGPTSLSYRTLRRRSAALARRLLAQGVAPDSHVALCAGRSSETLVGLLAILEVGAAYVPLDPEYPAELLAFMCEDSGSRLAVAPPQFAERLPACVRTLVIDDAEDDPFDVPDPGPEHLAYVIYTSGSTGHPKGVAVTRGNLAHSTRARFAFYEQSPARFLLLPSFSFDSSVAGIFWTLCAGGLLVLPEPGHERDPAALGALIDAQGITHTLCLPSLYALLLQSPAKLDSLETVIVAGESCPPSLPAQHRSRLPRARLFNEYGPTEGTVWSTVCELVGQTPVSIGKPIPGATVYLLNETGQSVEAGQSGEIHIGGAGVACGYLNRPDLTAEKFVSDPWSSEPAARLFKSGDLARRLPDGNLEFLGRTDRQVKIRGYRIELDAIEAVLQSHPEVRGAAVLAREDEPGAMQLAAYVVPGTLSVSGLRRFLAEKLPEFMHPAVFVMLDALPLTPNGKVDRAALPAPKRSRPELEADYVAPRTAIEHWLEEEWRAVLRLDRVGIHDKFFELGGDSLRAATLANRLQQRLDEPVFVVAIFVAPSIAQLAEFLKANYAQSIARHFGDGVAPVASGLTSTLLDRVRGLLPQRRVSAVPKVTRKNRRAIFILAPPRSGTTLLRAMLARHPDLFTTSELRLLGFNSLAERRAVLSGSQSIWHRSVVLALAGIKGCDEAEAARIVAECEEENFSIGEFFALLQNSVAPCELVDKSPSYALDPGALRHAEELFDGAFYVHLSRHPCEMIRSFAERRMDQVYLPPGAGVAPHEAGEAVWSIAHRNILDFLATVPAARHVHIRFADLVRDPRSTMESLCAALGIPFDLAVLDPYESAPAAEPSGVQSFDDPRFNEHRHIDSSMAEVRPGSSNGEFLSDQTWQLAAEIGYARPVSETFPPARPPQTRISDEPIAIIGMAGRFPGAQDVETFWKNLCDGVESIRAFTPDELRASGVDPSILAQPGYVNAGAVPEDADRFAASFFGYTPREAELMDPQQRLFLECACEAFEHAGCDVSHFNGAVGVYAGVALNSYFQNNLAPRPELAPLLGQYSLTIGNEKDFVATRVAHKLGLRGPAIGVQTACSSSLVAVHLACQSLRAGDIDLALVGGGRVRAPLHAGYTHVDGGIPSPDGHCRAFDANARGCVAASGIAAVVLKRLNDAQRDGDRIYAVIKSTAINNDGGDKAGFTAPAVAGQAEVIARAHAAAGITADTIGYVEAHGTGTSLGDPIEIAALTRAFHATSDRTEHCRIGSVKTNIGHLDAGAGVAGLIKTALALDRGAIPPSLNFAMPNPQIDFANSPFVVNAALTPWPRGPISRRAGVSSFGIGGTNAHAVIEEAPIREASSASRPWQLLVLSAKTASALDRATVNLARHLRAHPELPLADVASTLQLGRRQFQHRRIVVARDASDAAEALEKCDARRVICAGPATENPPVAFMFPGQGAQHPGMARELFENEPVFRDALKRCAELLLPDLDLLAALYPGQPTDETMTATAIAQPAIFSVEYALAKMWQSWGIEPAAMLGHSVGEFTSACLAGVFTLEDAITLLAGRARLMQKAPAGAMLAVRLSESDLRPRLRAGVELAAINSPRLCVVSGSCEMIAAFAEEMAVAGVACAPLQTSHAFHSAMMEPVVAPLTDLAQRTRFHAPRVPLFSTLTGAASADFASADYWVRQLRQPVRFAEAVASVPKDYVLLEVGPGTTLAPLARQSRGGLAISSLHASGGRDQCAMLEALGRLWLAGVAIDWSRLHSGERRLRVPLPTYPFERERYWIDAPAASSAAAPALEKPIERAQTAPLSSTSPREQLHAEIKAVLHELSGTAVEKMSASATFLELGFDSLFLTQATLAFRKRFGVTVAFRQLFEELSTIDALAAFIENRVPQSQPATPALATSGSATRVVESFGPFRPIDRSDATPLTAQQRAHLDALAARYSSRTTASKAWAAKHRAHFADPRSVSGFRPFWKELVYPIVVERSAGSKLWDIDGHEYIDFTMGYGTNLLGHSPRFITEAIAAQLERGIEIGPQSPLAGEVARLLCEFSGLDRAAFCNTGSEAVLAAVRVARTVTGRARVATCSGYHGINDEFLVRAKTIGGERRTVAIAPGIPDHVAREVLAVEYGAPDSLETLRAHAKELAAVVVEPVQSRHPALQPREFLHELRGITREAGAALVFDEVITGFRCHPGGAQACFGVRADLVTYGKIIGGGMPIGALCGRAQYMDALDGGAWQFGDGSRPETGVTFFAGTYVRHPLAMAASHAMLTFLKHEGAALQQRLNERTRLLVSELSGFLAETTPLIRIESFGSMFIVKFSDDFRFGGLLFFHLREKGIHAWDNRLLFLSTAHTEEDIARFAAAFRESVAEMRAGGFLEVSHEVMAIASPEERVVAPDVVLPPAVTPRIPAPLAEPARPLQFSLYFFGNYPAAYREDKYELVIEGTRFADRHGFTAVWLPERHFHSVGGFSPNAAVMAAALARETSRVQLRAGSVVLPLHHPVRVAEEWSLVDNLSRGRIGISIASGWHPNDFVFAPEAYDNRRELCAQSLATIRQLWSGGAISVRAGAGNEIDVKLFPLPVQPELPVWLTCVQAASYARAGELGLNVLSQLQNQSLDDVAEKIRVYRAARARAGHDRGHVTILLHTFVAEDAARAVALAREPLREYLRSHVEISQRKLASRNCEVAVSDDDLDFLLDRAVDDYARGKAFIGTPDSCAAIGEQLLAIGVDEVGCLIDFGVDANAVLASLPQLDELRKRFAVGRPGTPTTLPLSEAQRGLCLLTSTNADASRAYNETSALELRGPLDVAVLRGALQAIVARHEALRTTIDIEAETQTVHPQVTIDLPVIACEAPGDLDQCLGEIRALCFDFDRAPLMDARLCRLAPEHHVLFLTFHHIFGNGPSYVAFFDDFCALYAGRALPPAMQLSDFVRLSAERTQIEAAAFWKVQFADAPPVLELPLDRPRPAIMTFRGARETMELGVDTVAALRHTGAQHGGSLFMTLLSAFQALLHRLSGQDDVVVGVPFSDEIRARAGGDHLFANTTNVVPLRSRVADETMFIELLGTNRQLVLEAGEHQHYFFGNLLETLNLPFDPSRPPLFAVLFNYESGSYRHEMNGVRVELVTDRAPYLGLRDTAMFELYLNVAETEQGLFFRCDYNTDLFDAATVRRWLGHLRTLLEAIVSDPARLVTRMPLLSAAERVQALDEWNRTALEFPQEIALHELFEETARQTPDACAVLDHGVRVNYLELDQRANRIARRLRMLGVGSETFVGVCMERSADLIAALLGILKAGGAYVPLDPNYPHHRLALMLDDSRPRVVLCDAANALAHRSEHPGTRWETLDSASAESDAGLNEAVNPRQLAYLIYTSGSTGQPKGVALEHRSAVAFVHWARQKFSPEELAGVLAATSICFDLSVFEIFVPLATGGTIVLARNILELPDLPEADSVTLVNTVPSAMAELARAHGLPANVRTVFLAGEPLSEALVTELRRTGGVRRVCDGYGPTETGYATFAEREPGAVATIGRPIGNTHAYLFDSRMQPVPVGVTGEIYIGGAGVARGYWQRSELTAERFVPNPFCNEVPGAPERLYRTGDLARRCADGQLVYLGRADQQVKMRGYRVELGEIEAALCEHPAIREAAVIARAAGTADARLLAYLVPRGDLPATSELRAFLKQKLPDYMLPAAFVGIDRLPLTPNGKLDREALPEPDPAAAIQADEFVEPRNEMEKRIAEVWRNLLKVERVSVHDDFFALGGHSLTAMQAVARLRGTVLPGLNVHHMFAKPTIAGLVEMLGRRAPATEAGCELAMAGAREEGVL